MIRLASAVTRSKTGFHGLCTGWRERKQGMNRSADREGNEAASRAIPSRWPPIHHPSGSFPSCFGAKPPTPLGLTLAAEWVLISEWLNWGSWLLSSVGALNVLGYTVFLVSGAALGFLVFHMRPGLLVATMVRKSRAFQTTFPKATAFLISVPRFGNLFRRSIFFPLIT